MTPQPDSFSSGSAWFQAVLSGAGVTGITAIAIAALGVVMMTGRIDLRRIGRAVLGAFLFFGASAIASEMLRSAQSVGSNASITNDPDLLRASSEPLPRAEPSRTPQPFDPYAVQ